MAAPSRRLFTADEVINSFMLEGSDIEEDVVRCYDVRDGEEIDDSDCELEFLDVYNEETLADIDADLDLDRDVDAGNVGTSSISSASDPVARSSRPSSSSRSSSSNDQVRHDPELQSVDDYHRPWDEISIFRYAPQRGKLIFCMGNL
ncbi:hypothetical protein ElyMa_001378600 [Elysia marginata]|uniref:PiggyBac transposable element-derived protein domain-containing protein n=1 Tax=Elysia marginata TaxID=1093978 RepID=A0AAV4IW21_9GAST|nr:hypothetical protein ElyMa_001378600 [Elysia marginata]